MPALTKPQFVELYRIAFTLDEGDTCDAFAKSATVRALVRRGLISLTESKRPFGGPGPIGRLTMTVTLAEPTAQGYRQLDEFGFAPFPAERAFLAKRRGTCIRTYRPFVAALAKGWIEVVDGAETGDGWARWKATEAGKEALRREGD